MMAYSGWKEGPAPRPGFTLVEAKHEQAESPVVVAVHDSTQAIRLFRAGLDEAMSRSSVLVVLDYGTPSLREQLEDRSQNGESRERSHMRALWANSHVRMEQVEPETGDLESTVSYCEAIRASLLIVGADHISGDTLDSGLADRIFNGDFDVLMVSEHPNENRLSRDPSDEG